MEDMQQNERHLRHYTMRWNFSRLLRIQFCVFADDIDKKQTFVA